MKRLFCVFLFVLFVFCGCHREPEKIQVNKNFSMKAEIEFNSTAFTADFISNETGCSAVFLSPDNIKGFRIDYNGIDYTYSFEDITFNSGADKAITGFTELFYHAIQSAPELITENETSYTLQGTVLGYLYYLNINKEVLTPTFFEVEQLNLTVRFL